MPGAWQGSSLLREGQTAQLRPSPRMQLRIQVIMAGPSSVRACTLFCQISLHPTYTASCWAGVEGCFANPLLCWTAVLVRAMSI